MLLALPLVVAIVGQAGELKPGDRITFYAEGKNGVVLMSDTEEAYARFLGAVRAGRMPTTEMVMPKVTGGTATVLAVHPGDGYPIKAPVAELRLTSGSFTGEVRWVAVEYLRHPTAPRPGVPTLLPSYRVAARKGWVPGPGAIGNVHAEGRSGATGYPSLATLARSDRKAEGVVEIELHTPVRVIRWARRPVSAVECEVTWGDHESKTFWLPSRNVVRYDLIASRPKTGGGAH